MCTEQTPAVSHRAGGVPLSDLRLYRPPRRRQRTAAAAAAGGAAAGDEQAQPPALPSPPQQQPDSRGTSDVVDWGSTIRSTWDISERGALQLLNTFLSSATGVERFFVEILLVTYVCCGACNGNTIAREVDCTVVGNCM